jgi:hypothetical protein
MDTAKLMRAAAMALPYVKVMIGNLLLQPMADGVLRMELVEQPCYASVWEALNMHGSAGEVELRIGTMSYFYWAQHGADGFVYLTPSDSNPDGLPDPVVFARQSVNLFLKW